MDTRLDFGIQLTIPTKCLFLCLLKYAKLMALINLFPNIHSIIPFYVYTIWYLMVSSLVTST